MQLREPDVRPLAPPRSGATARASDAGPQHARLLVIDGDEERVLAIKAGLEQQGFAVSCAGDGPAGLALMHQEMPDLLLVNAILPGMTGIDVCRHLRRAGSEVPIIVLSPRSDEIDVVVTMEIGADDFIAKPCGMRELVARVRAVLRRSTRPAIDPFVSPAFEVNPFGGRQRVRSTDTGAEYGVPLHAQPESFIDPRFGSSRLDMPDDAAVPGILTVGDLSLDRWRHEVLLRGEVINLPLQEFVMLEAFLEQPGRLITHQVLIERIWGQRLGGNSRILSTLVNRLRGLIESDANHLTRIVTIRGLGYRCEVGPSGVPTREGTS